MIKPLCVAIRLLTISLYCKNRAMVDVASRKSSIPSLVHLSGLKQGQNSHLCILCELLFQNLRFAAWHSMGMYRAHDSCKDGKLHQAIDLICSTLGCTTSVLCVNGFCLCVG